VGGGGSCVEESGLISRFWRVILRSYWRGGYKVLSPFLRNSYLKFYIFVFFWTRAFASVSTDFILLKFQFSKNCC
jgi:hypothetical protein